MVIKKNTFLDVANLIRVFHIKRCMREFPYGPALSLGWGWGKFDPWSGNYDPTSRAAPPNK